MSQEFDSNFLRKIKYQPDDKVIARVQSIYNDSTAEEQRILRQILAEFARYGVSDTYDNLWLADFKEKPVDIHKFLCDSKYLGKTNRNGEAIFPFWKQTMTDLFNAGNKYDEVILTGATRIGKSSTAVSCIAYMLYRLMCLKNPQKFYGIKDVSTVSIFFFNLTLDMARGVSFKEFIDTLKASPWFQANGKFTSAERYPTYIPDGGKVDIKYGSSGTHALGTQCYAAFCDEIAFAKAGVKDLEKAKKDMRDLYNIVSARIKGTFRKDGEVHGKLFAVSSKNTESDFLEEHIKRQRDAGADKNMFIVDKPQWEILPPSRFSDKKFYIAVGSKNQRGFVVPENQEDEESLNDIRAQGFKLLNPPIDMRPEFVADFDIALRDLAGISVPGTLSYISMEAIQNCLDLTRRNPFYSDVVSIGTKDTLTLEEFFHLEAVDPRVKHLPHYIHMDLSLNTDKTGLGMICEYGRKKIDMPDGSTVSMPQYYHDFSVSIEAPRGDKIPYHKVLQFILWLRKQGYNIARISRDQFQSEYMAQLLEQHGFIVDKISVDRTPDGYIALRSILLEERILMLDVEKLKDELIGLQRDSFSGKIDHSSEVVGKDMADGLCGAIWNSMLNAQESRPSGKHIANAIASVNGNMRSGTKLSGSSNISHKRYDSSTSNADPFAGTIFSNYKKY